MFSKILIAFDGNNLNVIRALGRVSRSSDVKIFLISVAKINLVEKTIRLFFSLISKEWRPSNYAAIEKSAATAVQDLAVFSDKVISHVRIGDPYLEIKKLIKETQPDLIIMGGSLPAGELSKFSTPTVGMRVAAITKATLLLAK